MSEPPISRGFRGRRGSAGVDARLPPGQHLVTDFPVLSAGPTPEPDLASWRFTLEDGDSPIGEWSWAEFNALPQTELTVDIHCVTTWSKFDTHWRGVSIDALLEAAVSPSRRPPSRLPIAMAATPPICRPRIWSTVRPWWRPSSMASRSIPSMAGRRGSGAASLFLEEREMGAQAAIPRRGPARFLGRAWLSQLWRSLARAAL